MHQGHAQHEQDQGCSGRGWHGTPDSCLPKQRAKGHLQSRHPTCITRSEWKCPEYLGSPRAASGTREEAVSQGCSPGKCWFQNNNPAAPLPAPTRPILGQRFSLWPEKSHHSKLLKNPSNSLSSYLSCWLAVVGQHSKLEFNNLGVDGFSFMFLSRMLSKGDR